jgi:cell division protein FtsI (penicillin-binding protein 3)
VADKITPDWRSTIKNRLTALAVIFACWIVAIVGRLFFLQVISHADLVARAERQLNRTVEVAAKRGEIYDRNGRLLAYSVDADTIYAVPSEMSNLPAVAATLCRALDDCDRKEQTALAERLANARNFAYVKRRVTPAEAQRVSKLELKGIGFSKESKRFYPLRELAAHVIGYAGLDNVGLGGIEATYDKIVRGQKGKLIVQADARGKAFSRLERSPTAGGSIELTIDSQLQFIAERELRAGVQQHRADSGTAVVMDPNTGERGAMANYPTFNPNVYTEASENARRNRAIQDLYEPGSTFKLVTASAALELFLFKPSEMIDVSAGLIRFKGRVITDMHRYGPLSFTDVLVKSSNVGAIKIGARVGAEQMGRYVRRFGFGSQASPRDFPGESPGIVWSNLGDSALASVSMGYQVGVTPLQVVTAASVVANGGTLFEPRVVSAVTREGIRSVAQPRAVRTVITPETAATLTTIMEQVVERGTATRAKVAGYTIAGKTGTADKLVNRRYSNTQQNVSFVGFAPSRTPRLAVIVMVDSPRDGADTGGVVAAPIFQRIAEDALRYLGVPPNVDPAQPVIIQPRNARAEPVRRPVVPQVLPVAQVDNGVAVLPDLRGYGAREAIHELARLGLTPRVRGTGVVVDQSPEPGSPLEPGTTCTLVLTRAPHPALVAGVPQ